MDNAVSDSGFTTTFSGRKARAIGLGRIAIPPVQKPSERPAVRLVHRGSVWERFPQTVAAFRIVSCMIGWARGPNRIHRLLPTEGSLPSATFFCSSKIAIRKPPAHDKKNAAMRSPLVCWSKITPCHLVSFPGWIIPEACCTRHVQARWGSDVAHHMTDRNDSRKETRSCRNPGDRHRADLAAHLLPTLARHAVVCPCRHDTNVLGPFAPSTEGLRRFLGACQQSRSHAVLFLVLARAAGSTAASYIRDGPGFAQRRFDRSPVKR